MCLPGKVQNTACVQMICITTLPQTCCKLEQFPMATCLPSLITRSKVKGSHTAHQSSDGALWREVTALQLNPAWSL